MADALFCTSFFNACLRHDNDVELPDRVQPEDAVLTFANGRVELPPVVTMRQVAERRHLLQLVAAVACSGAEGDEKQRKGDSWFAPDA